MELTWEQMDFIRIALEAHINTLRKDAAVLGEPLVTKTIEERIDKIGPVYDALVSGDCVLILEEY